MTWNYRLIKKRDPADDSTSLIGVHEVYHDDDGNPRYWTANPVTFVTGVGTGEDDQEKVKVLKQMIMAAFDLPILDHDKLLWDDIKVRDELSQEPEQ